MRIARDNRTAGLNTLSGGHPLGGVIDDQRSSGYHAVSIPSQAGILLAGRMQVCRSLAVKSQYPLRRASSWRAAASSSSEARSDVSIPSQAGILLAGMDLSTLQADCHVGLNTLSGGHPLGGSSYKSEQTVAESSQYPLRRASSWRVGHRHDRVRHGSRSQYPLRRASSWRTGMRAAVKASYIVSIPSQAGILLAGASSARPVARRQESQYPLRRASSWRRWSRRWSPIVTIVSQYPLRRASSWRTGHRFMTESLLQVSIPSQAGILLAGLTWLRTVTTYDRLNTLSGGHPLGGWQLNIVNAMPVQGVSIPSQAGILLADVLATASAQHRSVSIPSQAGILLAGWSKLSSVARAVSIPSQAGILLAVAAILMATGLDDGLNTLSGGHPLGGVPTLQSPVSTC